LWALQRSLRLESVLLERDLVMDASSYSSRLVEKTVSEMETMDLRLPRRGLKEADDLLEMEVVRNSKESRLRVDRLSTTLLLGPSVAAALKKAAGGFLQCVDLEAEEEEERFSSSSSWSLCSSCFFFFVFVRQGMCTSAPQASQVVSIVCIVLVTAATRMDLLPERRADGCGSLAGRRRL
jgi:hypothetical protein